MRKIYFIDKNEAFRIGGENTRLYSVEQRYGTRETKPAFYIHIGYYQGKKRRDLCYQQQNYTYRNAQT